MNLVDNIQKILKSRIVELEYDLETIKDPCYVSRKDHLDGFKAAVDFVKEELAKVKTPSDIVQTQVYVSQSTGLEMRMGLRLKGMDSEHSFVTTAVTEKMEKIMHALVRTLEKELGKDWAA